jgi:hypothetical protein
MLLESGLLLGLLFVLVVEEGIEVRLHEISIIDDGMF